MPTEADGSKDIKIPKSRFYQHWLLSITQKSHTTFILWRKWGSLFFQEKSLAVSSQRRDQNCQRYVFIRVCVLSNFSRAWLSATPWTVARQAPLSMALSRQEHWSGWPCPPPGDRPDPGIQFVSLMSCRGRQSLSLAPLGSPICSYTFSLWIKVKTN